MLAALALFGLALVTGAAGGQAPKRARGLADRLAREGDEPSSELERLLHSRIADALNGAAAAAVIAILVLMVWKPGAQVAPKSRATDAGSISAASAPRP